MRDYLDFECVPFNEECEQMGPNYDALKARLECRVFIKQLRRQFGDEPSTALLKVKSNPHDFGSYLSVVCVFEENDEDAVKYAYDIEENLPDCWDEESIAELREAGYEIASERN
jgi:hypothetical protein